MKQNVDPNEINKFAALAHHWWDTQGELKTLHQINPLRLSYITEKTSISGKSILDVGCGGGILTESLAKDGATVTGIDLNKAALDVAKLHLLESDVQVDYQCISAEAMAEKHPNSFDIVTCFEMLEHVPDPASIVKACAALVKPGGHLFFSTLNRTPKSYAFAILGAEYILKLLPKNTHDYAKFIRPSELNHWITNSGLTTKELKGISYNPFLQHFKLISDLSVNYILYAVK
jgi:2-polyprenyl-6-hydroxyphenyl methylase/3-demethylubiquinone-9 3-methyltransferase